MTKAPVAATDHFHHHHRAFQPPNNLYYPNIKQPTADFVAPKTDAPKGENDIEMPSLSEPIKDLRLSPGAHE